MKEDFDTLIEAFNLFPDGMILVDENNIIVKANPPIGRMFKYSHSELIGAHINKLIPQRFQHKHDGHAQHYHHAPTKRQMGMGLRLKGITSDGDEIDVDIALSPVKRGDKMYTLAAIRDISDRLKSDRKIMSLERTKSELEKFSYMVSHDLKAPLHQIKSLGQLIELELSNTSSATVKEMIRRLRQSSETMENLITGILEYARAGLDEDKMAVNLHKVLNEVLQVIHIPDHFEIQYDNLPVINGNYTKIFQIFLNLTTNAIKYNDKAKGLLMVSTKAVDDQWSIRFCDNGRTVPVENRESIFELFHRGDRSEDGDKASHGVGLSIVKENIEQAGGSIHYEESPLGGSCFCILWPK